MTSRYNIKLFRTTALAKALATVLFAFALFVAPAEGAVPSPAPGGWFAGDIHVHRSCGGSPVSLATIYSAMDVNDLAIVLLLADSGNGEVLDPVTDLPLITGEDDPNSTATRIVHWDAEWHWDAIFTQFAHQALGGHVLTLGMTNATQVWEEYTYPILQMARDQAGIGGFAHMQYLGDSFPTSLNCCLPIEYPVEVALGSVDFVSEDVAGSDTAMRAWYRLLNCGFRPAFAAGSDYPCNANIGDLLTYVNVDGPLTYRKYIDGIAAGRTVVSRNAHREFLDLKVNGTAIPGDEINLSAAGSVQVSVVWTANQNFTGSLEIVQNGVVVASQSASVAQGAPVTLNATVDFRKSGWIAARRMSSRGHEVHTGAIFVKINNAPIRVSVDDAQFYVNWMDQLLERTSVGAVWADYYANDRAAVHARIQSARAIYQQIALEANDTPWGIVTSSVPDSLLGSSYSAVLQAGGGVAPYNWSLAASDLPPGLTLDSSGTISGTTTETGTFAFSIQVTDSSSTPQIAQKDFTIRVFAGSTLWDESIPAVPAEADGNAVELGLKFQSAVDGYVHGVRFYKGPGNTGPHVGNLWTSSGTLLASTIFANETAGGWQFQAFPSPVPITANTTYVVSYHAPSGQYAVDSGSFMGADFSNYPLRALQSGENGGNGIYVYGPGGFPNQSWGGANYWVDVLFESTAPSDTTAPTVATVSPGSGASNISMYAGVNVTFSESMVASTMNSSTVLLRDEANNLVAATVSYDSATATARLAPSSPLAVSSTYTAAVLGGTGGVKDLAGNPLDGEFVWSFTTSSEAPLSLWDNSVSPAVPADSDANAVELGLKFQSAADGHITGIRFYKGTGNVGPHIGNLWSSTGTLLGSVAFVNESASGWQTAILASPVSVSANTTYIVSYHAPVGRYAITSGYFSTSDYINGPLRALAAGEQGGNGVYRYGASAFPDQTWNGGNYWVDVLFRPIPDTTPPLVLTVIPNPDAIGIFPESAVTVSFSEVLDPASVNSTTVSLTDGSGNSISGTVTYNISANQAVFSPSGPLALNSTYTATILGGSSGVRDVAGNALGADFSWSFTTASQVPLSIWNTSAVPAVPAENDSGSVELGLKFTTALDGRISGVRFYKGPGNTGPHVGNLWTSTGELLASVTFQNETASGWQSQAFAAPIPISANTTYVISYHAPAGHYSVDPGYFLTAGVDNYPLRALANGENGGNGVYRYGAGSVFPDQTWNGGNYWMDLLFLPDPDTTPPQVLAFTPPNGSSGVLRDSAFTISFNEALDASSVTSATVGLNDSANNSVPGTVTYTAGEQTVTFTPNASLQLLSSYTLRVTGGTFGVKDLAGNALATDATSSFTTISQVPNTLWPDSALPAVVTDSDNTGIELGVKFQSDVNGYITGIRFYKGPENIGPHIGNLWTTSGTLLGTVTFQNETASGWQSQPLPSPVPITAGTTYVVSYHAPAGKYSISEPYFASSSYENPPLRAPADGVSGGNGLYRYSPTSTFPDQTYNSANFWVDVLFVENLGADTTAPTINSVVPSPHVTEVPIGSGVLVRFSETINAATVNGSTVVLRDSSDHLVPATIAYGTPLYTAVLTPQSPLEPSTLYTATVKGGETGIADPAGNPLSSDFSWSFTTAAPDNTPPDIAQVSPFAGATGVGTATPLTLTIAFNEAINAGSLNPGTVVLRDAASNVVPASVSYNSSSFVVSLITDSALIPDTMYTAAVAGGAGGVSDLAGNLLANDYVWSFRTFSSNPYGTGPGGPIAIITDQSNPFSLYYAEILLTEGLNSFVIVDVDELSSALLSDFQAAILGSISLTPAQVAMLSDWVGGGGKLVAMRPDKQLASLLGLNDVGATLSEGYLLVETDSGPGVGIVGETMQFHGTADRYALSGATAIATLYSNAQTATANPAVTLRAVGSNGGQVAAFTFDLARSVVLTRQGNPNWAGQDRDGFAPLRSNDLFHGPSATDPQPSWIDFNKIAIPQADEQQRLLANLVLAMNSDRNLLPRFWYFPHGHKAAVVMTGDDHANNGTGPRFDQYIDYTPAGASVEDWEAVRGASYLWNYTPLSDSAAASYHAAGFEVALHINSGCGNYTPESINTIFTQQLNIFRNEYPSLPSPTTLRMHCIAWSGYTILPETCAIHGIRMETSYYYFPASWVQDRPGLFTGSGMPMRFAKSTGEIIDVFQAATQMTDESGQSYPYTSDVLLDRALGPEGYYGAFVANMHTDVNPFPMSDAVVQSAQSRGVPVITARQLLTWVDAKNNSSFSDIHWSDNRQVFSVTADPNARGLETMVPIPVGYTVTGVLQNGVSIPHRVELIKGVYYAIFPTTTANYAVDYALDITGPVITAVEPSNNEDDVDPASAVSVTFNEPIDVATLNETTLKLLDATTAPVDSSLIYDGPNLTAFLVPDAPLTPGTTYTVNAVGGTFGIQDLAGNSLAADLLSSFTTIEQPAYTIWPDTAIPGTIMDPDSSAVELGLKFRSSMSGFVTGVRFYKGPNNTGTHRGNLWTSTGTLLGTVTFQNETASGWQQAFFSSPIPISANTTYVVSYHAPVGRYSVNGGYFLASGVDNGPLRALSAPESGGNGVYLYSSTSAFPNQSYNGGNYWVDVIFEP